MATKFVAPINALVLLYVITSSEGKPLTKKFIVLAENQQQLCLQRKNANSKRLNCSTSGACGLPFSLCLAYIISNKTIEIYFFYCFKISHSYPLSVNNP